MSAEVGEAHYQEVQRQLEEEAGAAPGAGQCSGRMEGPEADVRPQPRGRWSLGFW